MLYASIFLVTAGIVLIAYSFVVRGRQVLPEESTLAVPPAEKEKDAVRTATPPETGRNAVAVRAMTVSDAVQPVEKAEKNNDSSQRPAETPGPVNSSKQASKGPNTTAKTDAAEKSSSVQAKPVSIEVNDSAVLYCDASGVVDYEGKENVIDPTFKKYSKLKRIGKGTVSVIKDGINFKLKKKLYRFEFYRIGKMLSGKNYLALFIRGSEEVRLLIFDRGSDLDRRIIHEYKSYKKKAL